MIVSEIRATCGDFIKDLHATIDKCNDGDFFAGELICCAKLKSETILPKTHSLNALNKDAGTKINYQLSVIGYSKV